MTLNSIRFKNLWHGVLIFLQETSFTTRYLKSICLNLRLMKKILKKRINLLKKHCKDHLTF